MKNAAIICEYNPFHNGHKYQIDEARRITSPDGIVAFMSGNTVQRGDFAVFSKDIRCKAAISGGVDLVLENPSLFVLRSAEGYASAAVKTLSSLGNIDYLVFGAEHNDLDDLYKIADFLANETEEYKNMLLKELALGTSYPAARAKITAEFLGGNNAEILSMPNNLLAVEYLKAIIKQNSTLTPILIERKGSGHNDEASADGFASASFIRGALADNRNILSYVTSDAYRLYTTEVPYCINNAESAILSSLCLMSKETIANTPDLSEGLENKIKAEAMQATSLDALFESVKSKRYAYSRIRRAVLCAYLGITKEDAALEPQYIKILDFNEVGQKILNLAKDTATLPLAKNASPILKNDMAMAIWKKELEIDKVYNLLK